MTDQHRQFATNILAYYTKKSIRWFRQQCKHCAKTNTYSQVCKNRVLLKRRALVYTESCESLACFYYVLYNLFQCCQQSLPKFLLLYSLAVK